MQCSFFLHWLDTCPMDKLKPFHQEPWGPPTWLVWETEGLFTPGGKYTENFNKPFKRSEVGKNLDYQLTSVKMVNCVTKHVCKTSKTAPSLFKPRLYEHTCDLSLFLFNDALLVSSGGTSHTPFERTSKSTYQFIASVALHRLLIEDIPDSKCMYSFPPKS